MVILIRVTESPVANKNLSLSNLSLHIFSNLDRSGNQAALRYNLSSMTLKGA